MTKAPLQKQVQLQSAGLSSNTFQPFDFTLKVFGASLLRTWTEATCAGLRWVEIWPAKLGTELASMGYYRDLRRVVVLVVVAS